MNAFDELIASIWFTACAFENCKIHLKMCMCCFLWLKMMLAGFNAARPSCVEQSACGEWNFCNFCNSGTWDQWGYPNLMGVLLTSASGGGEKKLYIRVYACAILCVTAAKILARGFCWPSMVREWVLVALCSRHLCYPVLLQLSLCRLQAELRS